MRARLPPRFNRNWAQHWAKEPQHQTTGTRRTRSGVGWAFCAFAFGRVEFKQIVLNSTWLDLSLALLSRFYSTPFSPQTVQVDLAALPLYVSAELADTILFVGKAVRLLKRPSGTFAGQELLSDRCESVEVWGRSACMLRGGGEEV